MKQLRINQRSNHVVGTNIKKLRLKHNLRNADIVAKLQLEGVEISTSTFSKVESGTNNPTVELLYALTIILQCDFNAFFVQ
ncbi:MAG: helix-turn-helix domain-containing protein [Firmicutes bacterium]|nr:helix-turn-helix domain-containing protein [Bacillota bacterium]